MTSQKTVLYRIVGPLMREY